MRRFAVGLAILLVFAPDPGLAQDQIGLARGTVAEGAVVENLDGASVDLGQYVGSTPLLLEFWATWCPDCERLFPHMEDMHARYGDHVKFFAVAVAVNQSKRTIRRHLERHPLPFEVVWDTRGRATRAFQAPTTSYVVILNAEGVVVYTGAGADQDLEDGLLAAIGK